MNVGAFNLVPEVSYTVLSFFSFFFLFLFCSNGFFPYVFQLTYSFFNLIYSASPSSVFFISVTVLFNLVCSLNLLFVKYFLYLLSLRLHSFSVILDHLQHYYFELFFQEDCLSLLHLVYSSSVLSCSFFGNIFLCHLILSNLLCLQAVLCRL